MDNPFSLKKNEVLYLTTDECVRETLGPLLGLRSTLWSDKNLGEEPAKRDQEEEEEDQKEEEEEEDQEEEEEEEEDQN